jgi:hypothetical protein
MSSPRQSSLPLLPQHADSLSASGISNQVIEARGYRSVVTKAELRRLGFGAHQLLTPTLLAPIWSVNGEVALYHHRPDEPRARDGKIAKYEFPSGSRMVVDVHPFNKEKVRDPKVPLIVTEGVKKADAATSQEICCVGIIGTWNWRGTNEYGGKTTLPDWDSIALKDRLNHGREVILAYDSDVMRKVQVYQALVRQSEVLKSRGARVLYVYLPHGEDGRKVGLDDYLASGKSVNDLFNLVTSELRQPSDPPDDVARNRTSPYRETPHGLVWAQHAREGTVDRPLTNFTARIMSEVAEDDGAETDVSFEMQASRNGRTKHFCIPATTFNSMNWPIEQLGATAFVYPGIGLKDHARVAIQMLSEDPPQVRVYKHTGWREVEPGRWVFLHAGGAIGGKVPTHDDPITPPSINVQLPEALSRFHLPQPPSGEELICAIKASLRLLDLAPDTITLPLFSAIYRAPLGAADFSLHISGASGLFKTELAALAQQHYGPDMTSRNLPGSWSSTDNALEGLAFCAKDVLLTVDDWVPGSSSRDAEKMATKADRLLRAQGNNSGRQRMRSDGSLRPSRPPRGLIISTGEDVPPGQSLRGRLAIIEVSRGDISADRLSLCQRDAVSGLYVKAMVGYIGWLASRYTDEKYAYRERVRDLRTAAAKALASASSDGHRHQRIPEIVANLAVGFETFLRFAVEADAVARSEVPALWARAWDGLVKSASSQSTHQADSEPATRFIELVQAAIASGRAHITGQNGDKPKEARAWGWRTLTVGSGELGHTEWRPCGERIGWLDEEAGSVYLIPDAAYNVAKRLGSEGGAGLAVSPQTLWKRLNERGLLKSVDQARGTLSIRRKLEGATRKVLHLESATLLSEKPDISDIPDMQDGKG